MGRAWQAVAATAAWWPRARMPAAQNRLQADSERGQHESAARQPGATRDQGEG